MESLLHEQDAFAEEVEEDEAAEREGEDIENAEFEARSEDEEDAGSLKDFLDDEGADDDEGYMDALRNISPSRRTPVYSKRPSIRRKRPRVVLKEDTPTTAPAPTVVRAPPALQTPHTCGPLSQATPSAPRDRPVLPFEEQLFLAAKMAPLAIVLAKIPDKEDQFRVFSLAQGLRRAALTYSACAGRPYLPLLPRGVSSLRFVEAVRTLLQLLPMEGQLSSTDEAICASRGVRAAFKCYDPTPDENEEAEEVGRSQKKKKDSESLERERLFNYLQVRVVRLEEPDTQFLPTTGRSFLPVALPVAEEKTQYTNISLMKDNRNNRIIRDLRNFS
jgi:hypothetical protein